MSWESDRTQELGEPPLEGSYGPGAVPPPDLDRGRRGGTVGALGAAVAAAVVATALVLVGRYAGMSLARNVDRGGHHTLAELVSSLRIDRSLAAASTFRDNNTALAVAAGAVLVVVFLVTFCVVLSAGPGRAAFATFMGTWGAVLVAAVAGSVLATWAGLSWHVGSGAVLLIGGAEGGAHWAFWLGWLPALFAAAIQAMRRRI